MSAPEPAARLTIRDLSVLRVATHPLRQQILAALKGSPRAVREIAAGLGQDPHKLYYHLHLLEEHGLVRVADHRWVGGILEKHYQVTAHEFLVDAELVSSGGPGADPRLDAVLDRTVRRTGAQVREMVSRGVVDLGQRAPHPNALLSRASHARLSPERARELSSRILGLLAEFSRDVGAEPSTGRGYRLAITFHPCDLDDAAGEAEGV